MSLWREYVQFTSEVLGMPRSHAALIGVASGFILLAMIAQTWFIWVGIIATVLTVLALLTVMEYLLRAWYWCRDCFCPRATAGRCSSPDQALSDRPAALCADMEGRIENSDLSGHNVSAMAEKILRQANVRPTWGRWPAQVRFPAICRAMPSLALAGRFLVAICTR